MVDLALLVAVGVNEEGYREVLAVEPAGGERKEAWRLTRSVVFFLLKGLIERGLRGVRLVISDDRPSIRQAVTAELSGVRWQRCVVHFERNVLAHLPQSERKVVGRGPNGGLCGEAAQHRRVFVPSVHRALPRPLREGGASICPGYRRSPDNLGFPSGHQRHIKSTNELEQLFRAQPVGLVFW